MLLHLAVKAFAPAKLPFPVLHVDTGHNFPEVLAYRDELIGELGERLIVASRGGLHRRGAASRPGHGGSRNRLQTTTLLDAITEQRFDAAFGGARRDEDKARAKERVLSFRDTFGQWDPSAQRPELWQLYQGKVTRASTCAASRCRTGPSSTSGATSSASGCRCPRSTSPTPGPWSSATGSSCR